MLWQVQTDEAYYQQRPTLITVDHLAGPKCRRPRLEQITHWSRGEVGTNHYDRAIDEVAKRTARAERTGDPVDAFSAWQLHTLVEPSNSLGDLVSSIYKILREGRGQDPNDLPFGNAGVHVVRRSSALGHRARLISVLLRMKYDRKLAGGDGSHMQDANRAGEIIFASSQHLQDGIVMLDAYLAPLCAALTPAIWCIPVYREFGAIIYSLGQPLSGVRGDAAELLQVLPIQGGTESIEFPTLSPEASSEAIDWWGAKLNDMFRVLFDPVVFADADSNYVPSAHLQAVLTVEQLFRRVNSMQIAQRDINARRVLLFTILDTLERLTGRNLATHCTLTFARKTLGDLQETIPSQAAEVLLPAAVRAVDALEAVQDGFFMQRQLGLAEIDIPLDHGQMRSLGPEAAAAEYIKVLRDATHGHGTNKTGLRSRIDTLLAHHDGALSNDLPLLGYLYLLNILVNPEVLRKNLQYRLR
jgi:hypothetical protein